MTPEEHQREHERLHLAFDELLACYLRERFDREYPGGTRTSIHDEIFSLLKWSHEKTLIPSPAPEDQSRESRDKFLIAQNDDPELLEWLARAKEEGGKFVSSIAHAGLVADHENYPLIRIVLMALRRKYPQYEPTEAVKQQIRERKP